MLLPPPPLLVPPLPLQLPLPPLLLLLHRETDLPLRRARAGRLPASPRLFEILEDLTAFEEGNMLSNPIHMCFVWGSVWGSC